METRRGVAHPPPLRSQATNQEVSRHERAAPTTRNKTCLERLPTTQSPAGVKTEAVEILNGLLLRATHCSEA